MALARPAPFPPVALALLAGITVFWGVNWPLMKLALYDVPPWAFRVLCLAVGGAGLLLVARLNGDTLRVPRDRWRAHLAASLFNITGWHLGTAFALLSIGGGRASILAFTMPLWATLIGTVLGDRPVGRAWLGLALGMAGMACLVAPEIGRIGGHPLGTALMIGAALSWAIGTVIVKRVAWRTPLTTLLGWQQLVGGLPVVVGWIVFEGAWFEPRAVGLPAALATLYAAVVPMVFCYWAYFRVVELLPTSVATLGTLAIPIVGVLSSALLLGERVGAPEIAALGLVVAALALIAAPRSAPAGPAPREL